MRKMIIAMLLSILVLSFIPQNPIEEPLEGDLVSQEVEYDDYITLPAEQNGLLEIYQDIERPPMLQKAQILSGDMGFLDIISVILIIIVAIFGRNEIGKIITWLQSISSKTDNKGQIVIDLLEITMRLQSKFTEYLPDGFTEEEKAELNKLYKDLIAKAKELSN